MHRRYTIHRDGDLLVEELDAEGKVIEPEPVSAEDRLPFEITLLAPDGKLALERMLELLEAVQEIESGNVENWKPKPPGSGGGGGGKLPIV
jgi:hypothetical protein